MRWLVLALLLIPSCKKPGKRYHGLGQWKVGEATLLETSGRGHCTEVKSVEGESRPTYRCLMYKTIEFGQTDGDGFVGNLQLYFHGSKRESKLAEMQVAVRGCDTARMLAWTSSVFGQPKQQSDSGATRRMNWTSGHAYIQLFLDDGSCVLNFVHDKDKARIDKMKRKFTQSPPAQPKP